MATIFQTYVANAISRLIASDITPIGQDPGGTPADGGINKDDLFNQIATELIGYKLAVSISSDDLLIELTHNDDSDPSTDYPLWVKIGDDWYSITSALSVTISAGASSFGAGATVLAGKAVGLFVYLRYNATDGVTIGASRIPWGKVYSDFSATATNEKAGIWNDITNASAGDICQNIGYFEAQNAGAAGYVWSGVSNVRSKETLETNWLNWTPAPVAGNPTYTFGTITTAKYKIGQHKMDVEYNTSGTLSGSAGAIIYLTFPFTPAQAANNQMMGLCSVSNAVSAMGLLFGGSSGFGIQKFDKSNFPTSGTLVVNATGFAEIG